MRRDYLAGSESTLVGISWSGGGRGARIRQKSVPTDLFKELLRDLQAHNCKFVNLQYGDHSATLDAWANENIHIINDKRVDPLKNMDLWLSQVDACDYVISIANTTIHSAGGLGNQQCAYLVAFQIGGGLTMKRRLIVTVYQFRLLDKTKPSMGRSLRQNEALAFTASLTSCLC